MSKIDPQKLLVVENDILCVFYQLIKKHKETNIHVERIMVNVRYVYGHDFVTTNRGLIRLKKRKIIYDSQERNHLQLSSQILIAFIQRMQAKDEFRDVTNNN